jgi:hypothetical protein
MTIPEETLMAYADGELDPARRSEVEAAMAVDPEVAKRVERHRSLRKKIGSEFDPVLLETVPESLVSVVHAATSKPPEKPSRDATVTDLRRVRAARAAEAKEAAASVRHPTRPARPWGWFEWAAMAASLAAGAVIAHLVLKSPDAERLGTRDGHFIAQGDLDQALSNQLAGDQAESAPVHIGVSFKSKGGAHCRTFVVKGTRPMGGLACRENEAWAVEVLAAAQPGTETSGGYRPAASMPAAVVAAVEQQIQGEPLDASAEAAARAAKWEP